MEPIKRVALAKIPVLPEDEIFLGRRIAEIGIAVNRDALSNNCRERQKQLALSSIVLLGLASSILDLHRLFPAIQEGVHLGVALTSVAVGSTVYFGILFGTSAYQCFIEDKYHRDDAYYRSEELILKITREAAPDLESIEKQISNSYDVADAWREAVEGGNAQEASALENKVSQFTDEILADKTVATMNQKIRHAMSPLTEKSQGPNWQLYLEIIAPIALAAIAIVYALLHLRHIAH